MSESQLCSVVGPFYTIETIEQRQAPITDTLLPYPVARGNEPVHCLPQHCYDQAWNLFKRKENYGNVLPTATSEKTFYKGKRHRLPISNKLTSDNAIWSSSSDGFCFEPAALSTPDAFYKGVRYIQNHILPADVETTSSEFAVPVLSNLAMRNNALLKQDIPFF